MSAHETLCGRHTKHWWVLLIRVDGLLLSLLLCRHQRAHLHSSSVEARPFTSTSSSSHFKTFFKKKKHTDCMLHPSAVRFSTLPWKQIKKENQRLHSSGQFFFSSMRVQKRSVFTWIAGCCCKSVSEIQSKNEKKERSGNITRLYRLTYIQNKSLTIINNPLLIIIKTLNTPHLTTVFITFFCVFLFLCYTAKSGPFLLIARKKLK